jgi:hypothetical protein
MNVWRMLWFREYCASGVPQYCAVKDAPRVSVPHLDQELDKSCADAGRFSTGIYFCYWQFAAARVLLYISIFILMVYDYPLGLWIGCLHRLHST